MGKFMKYEIRGSYKFILGVIAVLIIASTIIQYNIFRTTDRFADRFQFGGIRAFTLFISFLVIFGAFLTVFIHIVGLFKNELYENRGYLTFTLPLTGNQILGAKVLVGVILYALIGIAIFLYNFLLATIFYGGELFQITKEVLSYIEVRKFFTLIIFSIIEFLKTTFLILVLVYLSIALSKVSIKNRKVGGLWFVIFLILNVLIGYITTKIGTIFPYYLDIANLKIYNQYDIYSSLKNVSISSVQLLTLGINLSGYINIFKSLAELIFIILGFLATGHLIEKRIDL